MSLRTRPLRLKWLIYGSLTHPDAGVSGANALSGARNVRA
jgi:hypothetical protein